MHVLAGREPGGCLSNEMGLGKTVNAVALIAANPRTEANGGELTDVSRSRQVRCAFHKSKNHSIFDTDDELDAGV